MQIEPFSFPSGLNSDAPDLGQFDIPICKNIQLPELSRYQTGRELLRLSKLNLDDLPIHRPVTIAVLSLLLERYELWRSSKNVKADFLGIVFSYLRHPQHRLSIRGYIFRIEGLDGWRAGFDALVEASWMHFRLNSERKS
ncbi:hypothetical protein SH449x_000208 [Pirellulaceae bacterium SH449]